MITRLAMLALDLGNPISDTYSIDNQSALQEYISLFYPMLMRVAVTAAVLVTVYGGYKYMTSGGDQEKITDARETILGAMIGLVLLILASVIMDFIRP